MRPRHTFFAKRPQYDWPWPGTDLQFNVCLALIGLHTSPYMSWTWSERSFVLGVCLVELLNDSFHSFLCLLKSTWIHYFIIHRNPFSQWQNIVYFKITSSLISFHVRRSRSFWWMCLKQFQWMKPCLEPHIYRFSLMLATGFQCHPQQLHVSSPFRDQLQPKELVVLNAIILRFQHVMTIVKWAKTLTGWHMYRTAPVFHVTVFALFKYKPSSTLDLNFNS